jgi:hypothetical protein
MRKHQEQITPKVDDAWRTDELFLKVKDDLKYLALTDDETRFWIARQVADTNILVISIHYLEKEMNREVNNLTL